MDKDTLDELRREITGEPEPKPTKLHPLFQGLPVPVLAAPIPNVDGDLGEVLSALVFGFYDADLHAAKQFLAGAPGLNANSIRYDALLYAYKVTKESGIKRKDDAEELRMVLVELLQRPDVQNHMFVRAYREMFVELGLMQ